MIRSRRQRGFTLIELLFSIAFITFIMLFIISTIVQVMQTYNKGLAIKEISQMARSTLDDMSRIARTTSYTAIKASAPVLAANRACFGGVSYVWNVRSGSTNRFSPDNGRVTFVRVDDLGGEMCVSGVGGYPRVPRDRATVLLTDRVWVHKVCVTLDASGPDCHVANPSLAQIVDLKLQLSTADTTGTTLDLTGPSPACFGGSAGEFCAVAEFTTTVSLKVR